MTYDWLDLARSLAAVLASWQAQEPTLAASIYLACLFGTCVVGMPSPSLIEIAGAAVLGFWPALLLGLPTAAIAALLPFCAARLWLGPPLLRRFPRLVDLVRTGVGRDGPLFLVTLRLMPGIPFLATNLFMGVTPIRARTFFLLNLLARLPMTILMCNAGTRLGQLRSLGDLLAPPTLLAFAGAALGPLFVRLAWRTGRGRRAESAAAAHLDDVS